MKSSSSKHMSWFLAGSALVANGALGCGTSPASEGTGGSTSAGGSGGTSGSAGDGGHAGSGGTGGSAPVAGVIAVSEGSGVYDDGGVFTPYRYGRVEARFFDGTEPTWHEEILREGACRLLEYQPGFCEEFCDGVCVGDNDCQPWPTYLSAGTLELSGLSTSLALEPDDFNQYYPMNVLPEELFSDDARVEVRASGADLPALDIEVTAVPALTAAIVDGFITLTPGEDHELTWTAMPASEALVKVTLNANNRGHGQPYAAILECEAPEAAASVVIPRALVDRFPETENWQVCAGSDCPRSTIARYREASTTLPTGRIVLRVSSVVEFGVVHRP